MLDTKEWLIKIHPLTLKVVVSTNKNFILRFQN